MSHRVCDTPGKSPLHCLNRGHKLAIQDVGGASVLVVAPLFLYCRFKAMFFK